MSFDAQKERTLTQMLADKAASSKKDPVMTAAEDKLKNYEAEVEKARIALHFTKIGAVGDIGDETTKDARMVLKDLHNMENLLAGQNTAINSGWWATFKKDKKALEFIQQAEDNLCSLSGSIIKLLHPLNLGNYSREADDNVREIQEASRKRQRAVEEKDAPRQARLGCT